MSLNTNNEFPRSVDIRKGLPRWLEVSAAATTLIAISPILLVVAVVIKLTSQGGVLFKQERVGLFGKNFFLYKFRTMKPNAGGAQVTVKNDKRITRIGGILRRTKFDELPGLWNIVRGDMSIVGPRPEVPGYVSTDNSLWEKVLQTRPGITDPVTLRLRNEEEMLANANDPVKFYLETLQPEKLRGYLLYLQNRTWKSDLRVIFDTFVAILLPFESPVPKIDGMDGASVTPTEGHLFFRALSFARLRIIADIMILIAAFVFSYLLRFEFAIPEVWLRPAALQLIVVVLFQILVLNVSGISNFIWRYVGIAELGTFIRAAIFATVPLIIFRLVPIQFLSELKVPLSIIIMNSFYAFGALIGIRIFRRLMYERYERRQISAKSLSASRKRTILIGAGRAGQMALREIIGRGETKLEVVGFVDDDPGKHGKIIMGVKVLGSTNDLPRLTKEVSAENAILTISETDAEYLRSIVENCEKAGIELRIMPGLYKLFDGRPVNDEIFSLESEM